MNKRHVLAGALLALTGLAGAGIAWWRLQPHAEQDGSLASMRPFWQLSWDDPQGNPVAMQAFQGRPLLLNFWATWCPPCVEELPLLNAFYRERRAQGWQVLGLAVDQPGAVRQFLQRMPLDFPVAVVGLAGTELSQRLGNTTGGLPYTVVFNARGDITQRKTGLVTPADLLAWAQPG